MQRLPIKSFSQVLPRVSRSPLSKKVISNASLVGGSFHYSTMKAARYYGKGDIRIEQIPEPIIRPGQVKVSAPAPVKPDGGRRVSLC